jgi:hypothetical protein
MSTLILSVSCEFISFSCNLVWIMTFPILLSSLVVIIIYIVLCTSVFEKQWCIFKNDKWIRLMEHEYAILYCVYVFAYCHIFRIQFTNFFLFYDKLQLNNLPLFQKIVPRSCGFCCNLHVNVISLPDFTKRSVGPVIFALSSIFCIEKTRRRNENFIIYSNSNKCDENENV